MAKRKRRATKKPKAPLEVPAVNIPDQATVVDSSAYDRHRDDAAQRSRQKAAEGTDIGDLPPCHNKRRRNKCRKSLRAFCLEYFPEKFFFGFSADHDLLIEQLERAVLKGELRALAMPRGSGKTTLCELAALWALIYGHRQFVVIVGADKEAAEALLESIKVALETKELLYLDFPEVCRPIRALDRTPSRCKKQKCNGVHTRMEYADDCVVLPTIEGSGCSGSVIKCRGITGRIRGMKHSLVSGQDIRPDLCIIDDPQTEESSQSPKMCRKRIKVLNGAISGLAGPGKRIAGMMPCTVLEPNDMADQILNRDLFPQWQGSRVGFVKSWPTRRDLWDRYVEILREDLKFERGMTRATDFYRDNRKAMDHGFEVYWDDRRDPEELSAKQHFWNKVVELSHEKAASELQNDPACPQLISSSTEFEWHVTATYIATKYSGHDRYRVPDDATKITAMIDVHGDVLYYGLVAWSMDFSGWVIDYGTWPDQSSKYFAKSSAKHTLASVYSEYAGGGTSALLHVGLDGLADAILGRTYRRQDGSEQYVDRCMIDANWGVETDTVYDWCEHSAYASILLPAHGTPIGINQPRIDAIPQRSGEVVGWHWRKPTLKRSKRRIRYINHDPNPWKVFLFKRLATKRGASGCLEIFGDPSHGPHQMLADHCRSEPPISTTGRYGDRITFDEPGNQDNHFFDVLVGCCIAASEQGLQVPGVAMQHRGGRNKRGGKRRRLSDQQ